MAPRMPDLHHPANHVIAGHGGEEVMQHQQDDHAWHKVHEEHGPAQRVQQGRLKRGVEGNAHGDVRIPQRESAGLNLGIGEAEPGMVLRGQVFVQDVRRVYKDAPKDQACHRREDDKGQPRGKSPGPGGQIDLGRQKLTYVRR